MASERPTDKTYRKRHYMLTPALCCRKKVKTNDSISSLGYAKKAKNTNCCNCICSDFHIYSESDSFFMIRNLKERLEIPLSHHICHLHQKETSRY